MKIKTTITETECNAEELRQINSLSDAFYQALRQAFNGPIMNTDYRCEDEEEQENE